MRRGHHRIAATVLITVWLVAPWAARADGVQQYPYELLVGGKSTLDTHTTSGVHDQSQELTDLLLMDMELFPPAGPKDQVGSPGPASKIVIHDGPAENLLALTGAPLPTPAAVTSPAPLLSEDLSWLEGLSKPDLPVRWDDRVVVYLDRFRKDGKWRNILRSWMSRTERYGPQIRAVLKDKGLPEDLIYLAMIESGYNPRAVSWAGAEGLWQFMPATGDEYGLVRTKWVDQRRNPELSTVAAATYLGRLHEMFGTWDLAMAAYNMGQGALMSSVKKYNTNDYWKLAGYEAGLPWGTTNYVPKILAAAIVGHNREAFGMDDLDFEKPITYDVVIVSVSCKLSVIAKAAGVDAQDVEALNPELKKSRVPPDMLPYPVRIPQGRRASFEKSWPQAAKNLKPLSTYEVKFGDTLTRIAKVHGTTVKELASINDIPKKDVLIAGETLLVPQGPPPVLEQEEPPAVGVPAVQFVYPDHRRVFYEIISGDSLSAIGAFFDVTVSDLCTWNDLDPTAHIHPGMWLQIFVPRDRDLSSAVILEEDQVLVLQVNSAEFLDWQAQQGGKERIVYTVAEGETLKSISKKFGIKVSSIVRINQFGYGTKLEPGEEIVLYVEAESNQNED